MTAKGFKKEQREPWLSPEDIEDYKARRHTVQTLAKKYWERPYIIRKWLKEMGVKTVGRAYKVSCLTQQDIEQYKIGDAGAHELSEKYDVSTDTVRRWLREAGFSNGKGVIHRKCPLTPKDIERYKSGKAGIKNLADQYGVSFQVVHKRLVSLGVEIKYPTSKLKKKRRNERIVEMLKTHPLGEVAKKFKISRQRAHQLWKEATSVGLKDIRPRRRDESSNASTS